MPQTVEYTHENQGFRGEFTRALTAGEFMKKYGNQPVPFEPTSIYMPGYLGGQDRHRNIPDILRKAASVSAKSIRALIVSGAVLTLAKIALENQRPISYLFR